MVGIAASYDWTHCCLSLLSLACTAKLTGAGAGIGEAKQAR